MLLSYSWLNHHIRIILKSILNNILDLISINRHRFTLEIIRINVLNLGFVVLDNLLEFVLSTFVLEVGSGFVLVVDLEAFLLEVRVDEGREVFSIDETVLGVGEGLDDVISFLIIIL